MATRRPEIDDLRYEELVAHAVAALPSLAPSWTDHNATDPGITILEALAYVCDGLSWTLSRYDRSMDARYAGMLGEASHPGEVGTATLQRAVERLGRVTRAVTGADIVSVLQGGLAVLDLPLDQGVPGGTPVVVRANGPVMARIDTAAAVGATTLTLSGAPPRVGDVVLLGAGGPRSPAEALIVTEVLATSSGAAAMLDRGVTTSHDAGEPLRLLGDPIRETEIDVDAEAGTTTVQWSPIQLPEHFVADLGAGLLASASPLPRIGVAGPGEVLIVAPGGGQPGEDLCDVAFELLRRRAPAASRFTVRGPRQAVVDIAVSVVREPFGLQRTDALQRDVSTALARYLDPVNGGPDGSGWPFGFPVHRSALDNIIERVPGVDHVHWLAVGDDERSDVWPLSSDPTSARRSLIQPGAITVTVLDSAQGW